MPEAVTPKTQPASSSNEGRRLDASFVRSVFWTGAAKGGSQLVSWLATFVVARLLTPEDYGLMGMATVFLGIVTIVTELGLGVTIVTLRDLTARQLAQLNTVAVVLGVAGFLVCCLAAIPLGWFFRAPALPRIVLLLGLTFPLSAIRIVPNALLQRELRFRLIAALETINVLVLSGSMVVLAMAGFRYWTLVLGAILSAVITTVLTVACRPQSFEWPKWRALDDALTFTKYQLGGNLLWYGYSHADLVIAGRLLGKADLGTYSMALSTATAIPEKVTMLLTGVTPAYFAALQDEPAALKRYLVRLTEVISVVTYPALVGLALVADDFVRLALGPKWLGVVTPLRLLSIYAAMSATSPLISRVLTVRGQTRYLMWFGVWQFVLLPISFAVGSVWGATGIAAAWLIAFPITRFPILRRVSASIGVSYGEYLRAFWPATSSVAAMAFAVAGLREALPVELPLLIRLLLEVACGGCVYLAVIMGCHRHRVSVLLQLRSAWRKPQSSSDPPDAPPPGALERTPLLRRVSGND